MPRLGASHCVNNPSVQLNDLEKRFAPLGHKDRKFAYRLAAEKGNKKKKEDASTTAIAFTAKGNGPLVVCEPPCFLDECSKNRKMPLLDYATLWLDRKGLGLGFWLGLGFRVRVLVRVQQDTLLQWKSQENSVPL